MPTEIYCKACEQNKTFDEMASTSQCKVCRKRKQNERKDQRDNALRVHGIVCTCCGELRPYDFFTVNVRTKRAMENKPCKTCRELMPVTVTHIHRPVVPHDVGPIIKRFCTQCLTRYNKQEMLESNPNLCLYCAFTRGKKADMAMIQQQMEKDSAIRQLMETFIRDNHQKVI